MEHFHVLSTESMHALFVVGLNHCVQQTRCTSHRQFAQMCGFEVLVLLWLMVLMVLMALMVLIKGVNGVNGVNGCLCC